MIKSFDFSDERVRLNGIVLSDIFIDDPLLVVSTPVDFSNIGCIGNCDICPLFLNLAACGYERTNSN